MDEFSRVVEEIINRLPAIKRKRGEPMKNHTSFEVGGPARFMFFPETAEELTELYEALRGYGVRAVILGNGTNMLVSDSPSDMAVIKTGGVKSAALSGEDRIVAGAGLPLSKLAEFARDSGLTGLEFAHGIPGSVGGAITMNAGAYGREMKDVVTSTTVYGGGGILMVTGGEHGFAYRSSRFSDADEVVISTVIKLDKGEEESIAAVMDDLDARRRASQPMEYPSAGSTFKRPKEGYAAELIERAGLKGFAIGGAQVSEKHSGFVINRGRATFKDVMDVIDHVRETVLKRSGIELEPEVKIIR